MSNILIIIPARGGSKGIPRKNLRTLNGLPLIYYSIRTCLKSTFKPIVLVSSDDDEILTISQKFGAKALKRDKKLSSDLITLDPVIHNAYETFKIDHDIKYVITIQPTSPLLRVQSLDAAINQMIDHPEIDTMLAAVNDSHLTWLKKENSFIPNYEKRVNRQELPQVFKETGGFVITKSEFVKPNSRFGKNISLYELSGAESIDIDTPVDWSICEYHLQKKTVLFVITGYKEVGMGHVYNALSIADEILNHNLIFLVDSKSQIAFDKIKSCNYSVFIQQHADILQDIEALQADIIINDCLDTTKNYMLGLKSLNLKAINFEDLGEGSQQADLVINAMYPEQEALPNHYFGQKYFCLRNEFLYTSQQNPIREEVKNVLLSFGGTDPNNFTRKTLASIYSYCIEHQIKVSIILGRGYTEQSSIEDFDNVTIYHNANNMSDLFEASDIIFSSAGRTAFEIASMGVPAIILCQNQRETTHFFAENKYGFKNLGLGSKCSNSQILEEFVQIATDWTKRKRMSNTMLDQKLKNGKAEVVKLINKVIKD